MCVRVPEFVQSISNGPLRMVESHMSSFLQGMKGERLFKGDFPIPIEQLRAEDTSRFLPNTSALSLKQMEIEQKSMYNWTEIEKTDVKLN